LFVQIIRNYQQNKNATRRRKNPKIAAAPPSPNHAHFSAASQAVVINYAAQKRRHNVNKHLTSNLQLVWWPKCSRSVTASGTRFPPSLSLSRGFSLSFLCRLRREGKLGVFSTKSTASLGRLSRLFTLPVTRTTKLHCGRVARFFRSLVLLASLGVFSADYNACPFG